MKKGVRSEAIQRLDCSLVRIVELKIFLSKLSGFEGHHIYFFVKYKSSLVCVSMIFPRGDFLQGGATVMRWLPYLKGVG